MDDETFELRLRPRATETVVLEIPKDTLASIEKVAASRDMAPQALLKLYIGQGLRQDVTNLFAERVFETTAHVLSQHLAAEEASAILQEIRLQAVV